MSEDTVQTTVVETNPVVEKTEQPVEETPAVAEAGAEETPKVEDPQKEAAKAEEEQKQVKAKQFAYLQKQERKLRERESSLKQELEHHTQQIEQAKGQLRGMYEQLQRERGEIESAKSQITQLIEQARSNPVEWLSKHAGITPEEYVARVTQDGKPTPEFLLKSETEKLNRSWEQKYNDLAKKLEEQESWKNQLEKERRDWAEKQKAEREEAQKRQILEQQLQQAEEARSQFWSLVEGAKDQYKDLLVYSREEVLQAAQQLVVEMGDAAKELTLKDIADELQQSTSEIHKRIREANAVQTQPPEKQAAGAPKAPSDDEDVVAKVANARRAKMKQIPKGQVRTGQTLNGDMAGRASISPPADDREARLKKVLASL